MKKAVILAPLFAVALSSMAFAQAVDKQKGATETVKISIGGSGQIEYVWRQADLAEWRSLSSGTDDTDEIMADLWIRFDVELTDKVSGVIEMGIDPQVGSGGLGGTGISPIFGQVYAQFAEVLDPAITVRLGQIRVVFDIRGDGQSIVLDTFRSESYFDAADPSSGFGAGALNHSYSAGLTFQYQRDAITLNVALLPVVGGAGEASVGDRLSVYTAMFWYNLDSVGKGSRLGVIAAIFGGGLPGGSADETSAFTIGAGVDLLGLVNNLEIFFEVYGNFGDLQDQVGSGGIGLNVGAKYNFESDSKPWVELKITFLSGEDGTDQDVDNYLSMENVGDLMILESNIYGVDWDTNMLAIKILGGVSFTAGATPNALSLRVAIGIVSAVDDDTLGSNDGVGNEVDIKLNYAYSKAANLFVALGALFGSDMLEGISSENEDGSFMMTLGGNWKW
jgi:opacity protein-like surface antigen